MSFLPKLRNTSAPSRVEDVAFFGLDRTEGAKGGYFSDTRNMVSVDFPFISSRNSRYLSKLPDGMKVLGVYSAKELCFVLGDGSKSYFYYGGVIKGEWEDAAQKEKFFCEVGGALYIYPDRKMYRLKNEKAIEDYISSHPRVGDAGEGYIYFDFDSSTWAYHNQNEFVIKSLEHKFNAGDAVSFYAFELDTEKKVPLYNLPKGVVMSDKNSFEDIYVYFNNFNHDKSYVTKKDDYGNYYIKVEYEFTYPAAFDEEFLDFSSEVISNEIYKDKEGNQYLIIHKSLESGKAVSSDLQKEFLEYNFQPGMTVFFDFTDEALRKVLPESAVLADMGVDWFYKADNRIRAAYLKFAPDTFNIGNDDWKSSPNDNINGYVILRNSENDKVYITSYAKYPALQGVACVNNRLWGYENNTIYASALGKPYIMSAYKGLSTDSWAVETGIKRDFTGVIEYGSIPHFFAEDRIVKVYGDAPSSFRTSETTCSGVKSGSHKSLCVCGGVLYYIDKDGYIASYTGSYPTVISRKLNEEFESGIFTCDERFLYCILGGKTTGRRLYTFDVLNKIWLLEGDKDFSDAVCFGGNVYLFRNGFIECTGDIDLGLEKYNESAFQSLLEFPVNDEGLFNMKKLKKVLLKINAEAGTELCVEVRETESAEYARVFERVIGEGDGVIVVPISCLRTLGYSIRIKARGKWRLEGIMRRVSVGSYKGN